MSQDDYKYAMLAVFGVWAVCATAAWFWLGHA